MNILNFFPKLEKIKETEIKKPIFNNIDFWFKEKVIVQLAKIKKANFKNKRRGCAKLFYGFV